MGTTIDVHVFRYDGLRQELVDLGVPDTPLLDAVLQECGGKHDNIYVLLYDESRMMAPGTGEPFGALQHLLCSLAVPGEKDDEVVKGWNDKFLDLLFSGKSRLENQPWGVDTEEFAKTHGLKLCARYE